MDNHQNLDIETISEVSLVVVIHLHEKHAIEYRCKQDAELYSTEGLSKGWHGFWEMWGVESVQAVLL